MPQIYIPQPVPVHIPSQTGIFKEFVTEALLHEKKTENKTLSAELDVERERVRALMKELVDLQEAHRTATFELHKHRETLMMREAEIAQMTGHNEMYKQENDELVKAVDAKDIEIQRLRGEKMAVERDVEHKKRLLSEKNEFYQKQAVNTVLASQQAIYEEQLASLQAEIKRLREESNNKLLGDFNQTRKLTLNMDGFVSKAREEELLTEIDNLRFKLVQREEFKARGPTQPAQNQAQQGAIESLVVRGYLRENNRLRSELSAVKQELIFFKDNTKQKEMASAGTFRFEEEDKLRETVSRLQDELKKKDEIHREKERAREEKINQATELERDWKDTQKKLLATEGLLKQREEEIGLLKKQAAKLEYEFKNNYREAVEEKEKVKKEAAKKFEESNRVRDENISLKKDIKVYREKLVKLEDELRLLAMRTPPPELAKKPKTPAETRPKPASPAAATSPAQGTLTNTLEQPESALNRWLSAPEKLSPQAAKLVQTLASRVPNSAATPSAHVRQSLGIYKAPILQDVDILVDSDAHLQQVQHGVVVEEVGETPFNVPKTEGHTFTTAEKALLQSLLACLPAGHPVQRVERLWDKASKIQNTNGLQDVKPVLIQVRDALGEVDVDIGQEQVLPLVNGCISAYNRADWEALRLNLQKADQILYKELSQKIPKSLVPGSVNLKDDGGLRAELVKITNERDQLAQMIKQTPIHPRDVDFAVLEKKIEMIEREEKMRTLETLGQLKSWSESGGGNKDWAREREQLIDIIKNKNREITRFRHEVDQLVLQLKEVRKQLIK